MTAFRPLHDPASCRAHYPGGDYCCAAAEAHAHAALEAGQAVACAGCGAIGDWDRSPLGDCWCGVCLDLDAVCRRCWSADCSCEVLP